MKSFFGLPAHPLLVHVPVVLLPMAAAGVVVMVIRPAWHLRYRWAVLVVGFGGALGAILAASAGESLASQTIDQQGAAAAAGWDDHADAGENARLFGVVFFVILAAFVLIPWLVERRAARDTSYSLPKWVTISLAVLALAGSAGTVITIADAGHSGAKAVWCETAVPPNCDD